MKINKLLFVFLLIIIFTLQFCFVSQSNITINKITSNIEGLNENCIRKGTSIYMWEVENIDYSTYDDIVKYLNINKVYAYIGTANIKNKVNSDVLQLFEFTKSKNIDTYIVYDENYSSQVENSNRIKELIEEVQDYNQTAQYKILGIAIDSEFYVMDDYSSLSNQDKIQRFKDYVYAMKEAYSLANQYGIKFVVCIPVWLDKLDKGTLEELIKDGCDYVQMMNYTKSGMVTNISDEIEFAKKYNKPIENIAEFQQPGPHEVTDAITFYNDGIDASTQKFEEIDSTYNYDLLTFSYHYLRPLMELIKDVEVTDNTGNAEHQNEDNNENNTNNNGNTQNEENNTNTDTNNNPNNENNTNTNDNTNSENNNSNTNNTNTAQEDNNSVINIYTNQNNNNNNTNNETEISTSVSNNTSKTNTNSTQSTNTTRANASTDKTVVKGILPQTGLEDNSVIILAIGVMMIIAGASLIKIVK